MKCSYGIMHLIVTQSKTSDQDQMTHFMNGESGLKNQRREPSNFDRIV